MVIDCIFAVSVEDWLNPDQYVVVCGDCSKSEPYATAIEVVSKRELSELMRDKVVIEYEKVKTKEDIERISSLFGEKYGVKFRETRGYTHEERIKLAKDISKGISFDHISAIYVVGSTAKNSDKDDSDLDMIGLREYCPDTSSCIIPRKCKKEYGIHLDFWCLTVEDLKKLEEVDYPLVRDKKLLYSKKST